MKNFGLILIAFLFISVNITSQNIISNIFQLKSQSNTTLSSTYNVNNLILFENGDFEVQYQKYSSKKDFKDNIIYEVIIQKGKWINIEDNIIELTIKGKTSKTSNRILFYRHRNNKLFYLNSLENSKKLKVSNNFAWKKIR